MKKTLRIALIVIGILYAVFVILGQTGVLKLYSNPTTANEPNLRMNSKMAVSNVIQPGIGDFVCYTFRDSMLGKHIRVHRLCGLENDTLEIRNGTVYLNTINIDSTLNLIHNYMVNSAVLERLKSTKIIDEKTIYGPMDQGLFLVSLEDMVAQSYDLGKNRIVDDKGVRDNDIKQASDKNWNKDHFGPLIIPKGKLFVLADNRDNSEDSRFIGCIDAKDIVGVVLKK